MVNRISKAISPRCSRSGRTTIPSRSRCGAADLEGVLLRNGPTRSPCPRTRRLPLFSGDGMLHGICSPAAGPRATATGGYAPVPWPARWPPSRPAAERADRRPATPRRPHAGTTLALVESGFPRRVPELDRARIHDFDGTLSSPMTAHPKVDPVTGELVFFGVDLFGPPFLRYHVVDAAVSSHHRGDRRPAGHDDARLRGDGHPRRIPRPAVVFDLALAAQDGGCRSLGT